jgi:PAS domain S-box-containing protein
MGHAAVKEFQSKYGLMNRQLALLCGCSLATIQKWRSGSVPVPGITQRLLALMDALFGGSGTGPCDFAERFAEVGESSGDEDTVVKDFSRLALQVVRDREFSRAAEAQDQKFQTYVESLPDMLVLIKPDGVIASVNRKFEELLSRRREEVAGLSFDGFCSEDCRKPVRLALERALRGTCPVFSLTLQHRDGYDVEAEASFSVTRQADENLVIGVLRNLQTVTEGQNIAERRLRYDRLLSELNGTLSGDSSAGSDTGIKKILGKVGAAAGIERSFFFQLSDDGLSIEQTVEWCAAGVSSRGIELMRPTRLDIPWLMGKLGEQHLVAVEAVAKMEPEASVEQQLLTELGVQSALFVLVSDRGTPAGIIGLANMQGDRPWHPDDFEMLHAVSDCIWAVMAGGNLVRTPEFSHQEFETALQEAGVGFWQWNISSGHTTYNGTWCAMLGYSPEEVESRVEFWKKRIHPDDFQQAIEQLDRYLRDSSSVYQSEFRIRHKDGRWIWVQSKGRITAHDAQGSPMRMAGTHLDITRQKASELRMQAAKERTEKSNLVKSEFLSDMNRRLRTPMNSILGAGQMLKREVQGAALRDLADTILQSSDEMMELIDSILDIPGLKNISAETDHAKAAVRADGDPGGPAVLIAEDNPANREVLSLMLQRLGCRTEKVANGLEAVEAAGLKLFDFIFMDIEMPVMNGLDAVREIRRKEVSEGRRPAIICAATAYARPGDREKYLAVGMNEYLPKPISMDALSGVLEKYAERK